MKISQAYGTGKFGLSFELFPPKTSTGDADLFSHVARLMDVVLSDAALRQGIVEGQLAALDRLKAKDFAGTLLRFVEEVRATPPRPAPEVPYDFWPMFDQAERLEELRQFRPAIYRALPSSDLRPPSSAAKP